MLDLHSHTRASDGTLTPTELVTAARARGVSVLAITDHDTVLGLEEGEAAAARLGLKLIPGVEISATEPSGASVHVLGYFFDRHDAGLGAILERLVDGRRARNIDIAARLTALGKPVSIEEVEAIADGTVGRPHFARVMLTKGYVGSFEEAFDDWLGDGKRAWVPRFVVSPRQAADALHAAGGIAILAHPLSYGRSPDKVQKAIKAAKQADLDGIEVHTGNQTPGETTMIASFTRQAGMLVSGGSDVHSAPYPDGPKLSTALLEPLALRAEARRAEVKR
ncbi:MAG: PHP domain-containing protein [Myxococcota bacterium]